LRCEFTEIKEQQMTRRKTFKQTLDQANLHLGARLYAPYDPGQPGILADVALSEDRQKLIHGAERDLQHREETWNECLEDFVGLHGAWGEPERIVSFAQRYGSLGFCGHRSEEPTILPSAVFWECEKCKGVPLDRDGTKPHEPLEAWRVCIRQARAALLVAAQLRFNLPVRTEDISDLFADSRHFNPESIDPKTGCHPLTSRDNASFWVCTLVNLWCRHGFANIEIRPNREDEGGIRLHLEGKALLGALGLRLAAVLTSADRRFHCVVPNCGEALPAGSKPRRDKPPMCTFHANEEDLKRRRLKYDETHEERKRKRKPR
jgi:hypothetical protein